MNEIQIKQFDELRKQYLQDLNRLRAHYLKRFLKVLKSAI